MNALLKSYKCYPLKIRWTPSPLAVGSGRSVQLACYDAIRRISDALDFLDAHRRSEDLTNPIVYEALRMVGCGKMQTNGL